MIAVANNSVHTKCNCVPRISISRIATASSSMMIVRWNQADRLAHRSQLILTPSASVGASWKQIHLNYCHAQHALNATGGSRIVLHQYNYILNSRPPFIPDTVPSTYLLLCLLSILQQTHNKHFPFMLLPVLEMIAHKFTQISLNSRMNSYSYVDVVCQQSFTCSAKCSTTLLMNNSMFGRFAIIHSR